ncbi:thioredoxin-like protein [Lindgomyces ingoldianus]|uniref:Thioredoxin-like protein n=1 Tax=Lindgomyces ingoldianus TaxID=673940 RepID=A0ACB6R379_9PLEO|nr:thioredoxin-like protein [Lindgomyces ingoldianus]KAF2473713.1 thioredoxin-like protein [Lindgomyces ingoldianus]
MPSQRRVKAFGLLVVLAVLVTLYMTSSPRQTRSSDFYTKTQEALQAREYEQAAKQRDADDVGARLKAAEEAAKKSADEKGHKYIDLVGGGVPGGANEKSVAGRVMMNQPGEGEKKLVPGVANVGGRPKDREAAKEDHESPEDHEVEVELNAILKKSPIIIFSKTFCPFSKKAKHILLDIYNIVPAPYVVELDQHPLGMKLQHTLAESTGRKTVPNVLLMGKSIGGGDDIEELHLSHKLLSTVKSMGGSRITEVALRSGGHQQKPLRV